jgi:hypothetical protein
MSRFKRGAMRLRVLDILTALILLAILLWASWKQFPAYNRRFRSPVESPAPTHQPSGKF